MSMKVITNTKMRIKMYMNMSTNTKRTLLIALSFLFLILAAAAFIACFTEHFTVYGISMAPTFRNGTNVLILKGAWNIRSGDIITYPISVLYPYMNGLSTHRVIAVLTNTSGTFYLTQGDNNCEPDGWVAAEKVIGKVILAW